MRFTLLPLPFLFLASTASLWAAQGEPASQRSGRVPTIQEDILVDARLEEAAWERALVLDDFTEVRPDEGQASDPVTIVRLMRSETHLYVGLTCMEPEPDRMVLQNISRDAFLNDDDRVEFVFDTFHDQKSSYWFQISAAGSRGDALLGENGRRFNKPWNGFWEGKTRILEDRWEAEIAIPFSTMAFGDGDTWGANFERFRGADRSDHRWASPRREFFLGNVLSAGDLHGFAGAQHGTGLEFRPFFKLKSLNPSGGAPSNLLGDLGGELSWRFTPQLTGALTWNTDFAETEVDERRVNLTRFPLFFPEKRDFFLQDSTLFQFGEGGRGSGNNLIPFFSRRIGLFEGAEVPLDVGMRVAGRAGAWDLGVLGVHTAESAAAGVPDGDLFVFRPSYNVNSNLAVGALVTSGNPTKDLDNTVVGADLRWSSADVLPGLARINTYLLYSDDEAIGRNGLAFGSQFDLQTRDWEYRFGLLATQNDFAPRLGFVRRAGQRWTNASVFWNPRPKDGPVRRYGFGVAPEVWTDLAGDTISSRIRLGLMEVQWDSGDSFRFNTFLQTDRPSVDFTVADGAVIRAGDYSWTQHQIRYGTSDARDLSASGQIGYGNWYDGDLLSFRTEFTYRPDEKLRLNLEYQEERGSVSTGDFTARIERLSCDYAFNADVSLETLVQADNISDSLGLQARFHWIVKDGREFFVVLDSGWQEVPSGAILPTSADVTAKVVYAIRF